MCGFFFIKKNNFRFNLKKIDKISDQLSHRGPDQNAYFDNNEIYAKFFRLSILDTSIEAGQPMFDKSRRYMLIFNGEIYNYEYLKNNLRFKQLKTSSDTEVLLYTLIENGLDAVKKIEGMFGFILYDFKKNEVWFARDRLGIKPLYYTKFKDSFIFSSEMKPLLSFQNKFSINDKSLCNFFFKGSMDFGKENFFKDIYTVEGGTFGKIQNKQIKIKNYWNIEQAIIDKKYSKNFIDRKKELKILLDDSIKKHLISDRKIGLFLSGGTDSNAILNLMFKKNSNLSIPTYTYGFNEKKEYSEIERVEYLLNSKSTVNNISLISPLEIINNFDSVTKILEGPLTSIRIFAMKKLYKLASEQNCKVIIEGDGGDEIFAGYDYNLYPYLYDRYKKETTIIKNIKSFLKISGKQERQLTNLLKTKLNQFSSTSDGTPFVNYKFFNEAYIKENINEKFFFQKKNDRINYLQNSQINDLNYIKLPRTLRFKDRLSMSEGVESRLPFLDHRIVEYGIGLGNSDKFYKLKSRHIFKNIFKKNQNTYKNFEFSKRSVADPQKLWLKTSLKEFFLDNISSIKFRNLGYFNTKNIIKNYNLYCGDKNYPSTFAFMQLLSFFRFHEIFKDYSKNKKY